MQDEASGTRARGRERLSSSGSGNPRAEAVAVKADEGRRNPSHQVQLSELDLARENGRFASVTPTGNECSSDFGQPVESAARPAADNTQAVKFSHSGGEETHEHSGRSSHIIPGVEHVFFEEELNRMEEQQHAAPAGMDIVVLAVDNSKPSDMAFHCE